MFPLSNLLAKTAAPRGKQTIVNQAEIVIVNPKLSYSSNNTLIISLQLINQGNDTAVGIHLTKILLSGGAKPSTPTIPNAFPVAVGDIAVGQVQEVV